MTKRITYEEFESGFTLSRRIYKQGKIIYTGKFKQYEEKLYCTLDDAQDLDYYDDFAYAQLIKKLLKKINKYV